MTANGVALTVSRRTARRSSTTSMVASAVSETGRSVFAASTNWISSTGIGARAVMTPPVLRVCVPIEPPSALSASTLVRSSRNGARRALTTMLPRWFSMIVVPIGLLIVTPFATPVSWPASTMSEFAVAPVWVLRISIRVAGKLCVRSNSNVAPSELFSSSETLLAGLSTGPGTRSALIVMIGVCVPLTTSMRWMTSVRFDALVIRT